MKRILVAITLAAVLLLTACGGSTDAPGTYVDKDSGMTLDWGETPVTDCTFLPVGYPDSYASFDEQQIVWVSIITGQTRDNPGTSTLWGTSDCDGAQIKAVIEARQACTEGLTNPTDDPLFQAHHDACLELQGGE